VPIYNLGERRAQIAADAYVAPSATLIGRVVLESQSSVWFGATLRGDNEPIVVGPRSNVQDGAVLHTDPGCPLHLGCDVTVGHQAMLHGCSVGDGALIGIQAVVLNGAIIGEHCLVGAGAMVTERKVFAPGMLILGAPARAIRALDEAEIAKMVAGAAVYVHRAAEYRQVLRPAD
jgi:carbonic anhydrase/acetyltransferase-like protein (isoleucine patch superfamily)